MKIIDFNRAETTNVDSEPELLRDIAEVAEWPEDERAEPWRKFYYATSGKYIRQSVLGFTTLTKDDVKNDLIVLGCHAKDIAASLFNIREFNKVIYSGDLPGWKAGIYDTDKGKIIVTSSPKIIEAKAGSHELITRIFDGLFKSPDTPLQLPAVLSWLKQARQNVVDGRRRPLPALAMVGPRECGKTLAMEIFKLCLGGRAAPAYRAILSDRFNGSLLAAELLIIDDEIASKTYRDRIMFGQALKNKLFSAEILIECKHVNEFSVAPVHAVAIAVNDEIEHVQVLPTFDDSLRDKISLIFTGRALIKPGEAENRDEFMRKIEAEIPAFVAMLEAYEIPENLCNARTGAAAWQNPNVLEMLSSMSAEMSLLELIRECPAIQLHAQMKGWIGTARELQRILESNESYVSEIRRLLPHDQSCGTYLGRLARDPQSGVKKLPRSNGKQKWEIRGENL